MLVCGSISLKKFFLRSDYYNLKYTIITGEPSGDMHGAGLMSALRKLDNEALFSFTGGTAMSGIGGDKILDIDRMSFMGFTEVILNLPSILQIQKLIKSSIENFKPDVVIFIDYPGLNLSLAKWAKEKGFKTAYYILPKAWAWKASRVQKLKKYVDLNLSIFPFELDFFQSHGLGVHYVGNPSIGLIKAHERKVTHRNKPILALLPGSRKQELKWILPLMLEATKDLDKDFEKIVSKALHLRKTDYPKGIKLEEDFKSLLNEADYAIVTSGTATLEAALFNVPQVVVYKSSWLSMKIAKLLVKLKYISLVNLIVDEPLVVELIQEEATPERIKSELINLTESGPDKFKSKYQKVKDELGSLSAPDEAAQLIYNMISS